MKKDSEMIQIISTGVEKNKSRLQYLKKENEIIRMYFTASCRTIWWMVTHIHTWAAPLWVHLRNILSEIGSLIDLSIDTDERDDGAIIKEETSSLTSNWVKGSDSPIKFEDPLYMTSGCWLMAVITWRVCRSPLRYNGRHANFYLEKRSQRGSFLYNS